MQGYRRILVAVDFSECAWEVCERAAALAAPGGATAVLTHVASLPDGVPRGARVRRDDAEIDAGAVLREAAEARLAGYDALFEAAGVGVRHVVLESADVAEALLEAAEEYAADVVVMGTHGRTGAARAVLGSVAESVVRRSPRPVLTVRSTHKAGCRASSCAWCTTHVMPEQSRLADEAFG